MARNNNNQRGSKNNNPDGRNQYSSGVVEAARDNPIKAAVTAAAAVGAGVFLWSRRNQISDQIGQLGEQISDWRDNMGSERSFQTDTETSFAGGNTSTSGNAARGSGGKSQQEFAEEALSLKETGGAGSGNI